MSLLSTSSGILEVQLHHEAPRTTFTATLPGSPGPVYSVVRRLLRALFNIEYFTVLLPGRADSRFMQALLGSRLVHALLASRSLDGTMPADVEYEWLLATQGPPPRLGTLLRGQRLEELLGLAPPLPSEGIGRVTVALIASLGRGYTNSSSGSLWHTGGAARSEGVLLDASVRRGSSLTPSFLRGFFYDATAGRRSGGRSLAAPAFSILTTKIVNAVARYLVVTLLVERLLRWLVRKVDAFLSSSDTTMPASAVAKDAVCGVCLSGPPSGSSPTASSPTVTTTTSTTTQAGGSLPAVGGVAAMGESAGAQQAEGRWRRLSCGHVFHDSCIGEWVRRSNVCPMCRRLDPLADEGPAHRYELARLRLLAALDRTLAGQLLSGAASQLAAAGVLLVLVESVVSVLEWLIRRRFGGRGVGSSASFGAQSSLGSEVPPAIVPPGMERRDLYFVRT